MVDWFENMKVSQSPGSHSGTNLLVNDGLPSNREGDIGQVSLRKQNGKYFLFIKVAVDDWRKVSQLVKANGDGSTMEIIAGEEVDGQDEIFNDVSVNNLTGSPIWAEFPFTTNNMVYNRYYFRDVDDIDDFRRWDSNDTTPTGFNYRNVSGSYTVPQNCKLVSMSGVIANASGTENPTIHVFTGTVTEGTGDTTLVDAGSVVVTVGTVNVPNKFNLGFNTNIASGDIVIPMIKNGNLGTTPDYYGSLTLQFKTI